VSGRRGCGGYALSKGSIGGSKPNGSGTKKDTVNGHKDTAKGTNGDTVNKIQAQILESMKASPSVTVKLLAAELGINERNVKKNIKALKDLGLVERVGPAKTGQWIVVEE
jgi:predicted HTH transcriptional regulator